MLSSRLQTPQINQLILIFWSPDLTLTEILYRELKVKFMVWKSSLKISHKINIANMQNTGQQL